MKIITRTKSDPKPISLAIPYADVLSSTSQFRNNYHICIKIALFFF